MPWKEWKNLERIFVIEFAFLFVYLIISKNVLRRIVVTELSIFLSAEK